MPQTSIGEPAAGYAGQITNLSPCYKVTAEAEGVLVAGTPVLRGTDPDTQAIAIADGDTVDATTFLGWVALETSRPFDSVAPIADEDDATVVRKGHMVVLTTAAVTAGNPVFVGNATAQLGDIDDASGTGLTQVPGCYFATSTSGAGLATIEINLP